MPIKFDARKGHPGGRCVAKRARQQPNGIPAPLKLLYIAERESLKLTGLPMIGGETIAKKFGPLHADAYSLIRGEHPLGKRRRSGRATLARAERIAPDAVAGVLEVVETRNRDSRRQAAKQFIETADFDIVEHTHTFSEWKKNYVESPGSSREIPTSDILDGRRLLPPMTKRARSWLNSTKSNTRTRFFPPDLALS